VFLNFAEAEVVLVKFVLRVSVEGLPNVFFVLNVYVPLTPKKFCFVSFQAKLTEAVVSMLVIFLF
jgi:hypothetical protein